MIHVYWGPNPKLQLYIKPLTDFFSQMANRIAQGNYRYGPPKNSQMYMTRLIMETKSYKRTGNREHLINIANYCLLESMEPEHKKYHFDNTVGSVTRK